MVDSKENYKFDLGVKGLNWVIKIMSEKAELLKITKKKCQNHSDFTSWNLSQSLSLAMLWSIPDKQSEELKWNLLQNGTKKMNF